jgi:hypothetical protein
MGIAAARASSFFVIGLTQKTLRLVPNATERRLKRGYLT